MAAHHIKIEPFDQVIIETPQGKWLVVSYNHVLTTGVFYVTPPAGFTLRQDSPETVMLDHALPVECDPERPGAPGVPA